MSDSVQPLRRQPTRLPRPWDSPGKNTGQGSRFLLQCMKVKSESESLSRVQLFATPRTAAHQAPLPMGFSRQEYWSGVPLSSPSNSLYYFILQATHFLKNTKTVRTIFVFFIQVIFFKQYLIQIPNNPMNFAILS